MTDAELIQKYQKGDTDAFETLLGRHKNALYTFLLRLTGAPDRADDLFQETFLRVLKALPKYREEGTFHHWLFRIANNVARDTKRRDAVRQRHVTTDDALVDVAIGSLLRPDEETERRDLTRHVEQALSELPEEQRRVFLLRTHANLRFREIAEQEGVSISTVISQMRYAVAKIKPILKPIFEENK
ncbi:MAG: sigma-70 family RNA polymerase sigma factor [Candidatus Latescibacteria bacterium]|jgi:RNA polymerase sigma-70 factor, ECF subfamily|nr:sigma-70 family RNA polymerase sigma factor [Candidatus Latescibacterota bacterium]MBT4136415.1 sigma-70 family RNA polymerase sigma factor [Candidatus Latescibacterota bacterium]MBT5833125.1 sigma-70 family RNA polymerase sigma factor [Candidatus Latescibacterota bacterium]